MLSEMIKKHLISRDVDFDNKNIPVFVDPEKNVAFFPLYGTMGKLIGYQRYNPKGVKNIKDKNDLENLRYKTVSNKDEIPVYGLHTIDKRPYVFLVEGIFDAVKLIRLGHPVIAALSNDPKILRNFLFILQKKIIVIADNDVAGKKLAKLGNISYTVPEEFKDLGEMPLSEVKKFIEKIMK
jgi:hypothetical protein